MCAVPDHEPVCSPDSEAVCLGVFSWLCKWGVGSIAVLGPAPGCCGLQVISPLQACTHPGSTQGLWVEGFDQGNARLLGGGQSIRGPKLLLLLSLAALGELLRDIVGGGCCQGLEVAGSRSRGLESTEEGGPKGPRCLSAR